MRPPSRALAASQPWWSVHPLGQGTCAAQASCARYTMLVDWSLPSRAVRSWGIRLSRCRTREDAVPPQPDCTAPSFNSSARSARRGASFVQLNPCLFWILYSVAPTPGVARKTRSSPGLGGNPLADPPIALRILSFAMANIGPELARATQLARAPAARSHTAKDKTRTRAAWRTSLQAEAHRLVRTAPARREGATATGQAGVQKKTCARRGLPSPPAAQLCMPTPPEHAAIDNSTPRSRDAEYVALPPACTRGLGAEQPCAP